MKEILWDNIQNGDIITWSSGDIKSKNAFLIINKELMTNGQCINISIESQSLSWLNPSAQIKFWYIDHIEMQCLTL